MNHMPVQARDAAASRAEGRGDAQEGNAASTRPPTTTNNNNDTHSRPGGSSKEQHEGGMDMSASSLSTSGFNAGHIRARVCAYAYYLMHICAM